LFGGCFSALFRIPLFVVSSTSLVPLLLFSSLLVFLGVSVHPHLPTCACFFSVFVDGLGFIILRADFVSPFGLGFFSCNFWALFSPTDFYLFSPLDSSRGF
jgi:hypothetical protein